MLPLAVNALPTPALPAPSVEQSPQTVPLSTTSDSARQQLPIAVSSSGAPAAYSPDTLQSRRAAEERRMLWYKPALPETGVTDTADDADAPQAQPKLPASAALIPNFFTPQSIRLTQSLVSQYTAQFMAQETPDDTLKQPEWKTTLGARKPSLGQAQGTAAYGMAIARNQSKKPDTDTAL